MKIFCLMCSLYLTDEMRNLLFYTALYMARDKVARKVLRRPCCEGEVTTDFSCADLGGMGGMLFKARLETDAGQRQVKFLVRTRDLEFLDKAEWELLDHLAGEDAPAAARACN